MDTKILIVGLIAGLLVGAGAGYGIVSFQVGTLQAQVNTLKNQADLVPTLQSQISSLSSDKTALQSQVTTLQGQLTTKTNEVNVLQSQINSLSSQISTLQSQALTKDTEIANLNSQINIMKAMLPPLPPASGEAGSSRFFPASIGTSITTTYVRGSSDTYTAIITVLEVIRGAQAWNMIYAANQYNDPAPVGTEYILVKIRYNYVNGPTLENLDRFTFETFSSTGVKYALASIIGPEPLFSASIYAGNILEGWAAYRVTTTDLKPVLSFGVDYKGEGGVWFKIYN